MGSCETLSWLPFMGPELFVELHCHLSCCCLECTPQLQSSCSLLAAVLCSSTLLSTRSLQTPLKHTSSLQIVSGARDRTIKLWNTIGECKYTIGEPDGHTEWVSCVRFSPVTQNPIIVSAGWDRLVKVSLLPVLQNITNATNMGCCLQQGGWQAAHFSCEVY